LTSIAVESQKTTHSDSPSRNTPGTGPSHSEQIASSSANVPQSPALAMTDWTKSVAIQSAEYGLNKLCCSFDITHTFTFILIGTRSCHVLYRFVLTIKQIRCCTSAGTTMRASSQPRDLMSRSISVIISRSSSSFNDSTIVTGAGAGIPLSTQCHTTTGPAMRPRLRIKHFLLI
jgi:hypothetical protein